MEPGFPVWSIRPNWRDGVLERLEWLTDVLRSSTGVEQRRALRLSPRRYVEITVNPTRNERSFLDLTMHRMGSDEWLFPLWFDQGKLSANAALGASRVDFDNTYREFLTGGLALLYQDAFTWEVISISGQDDTGLDLDAVLDGPWSAGTKVYPLRKAYLSTDTALDALTTTVGESVLLFQVIEPNDYTATSPADLIFETIPVIVTPPNRSQTLSTQHVRMSSERDNSTGIPYRTDPAGRAFQVQSHSWLRQGRQAQAEFREMLYWLRGRQRAVWLPSFNDDLVVSRNSAPASVNLDIEDIGYTYVGGGVAIPGRDVVLINGVTPARVTELGAPQSATEERLRIGAGLVDAVAIGDTGSFMSTVRLNQDAVELMHHTDSDGPLECSLTFQSFKDSRDASGAIFYPVPEVSMNNISCGTPGFTGLSWLLPCISTVSSTGCSCTNMVSNSYVLDGDAGIIHDVTLRIRGAVELTNYLGGSDYGSSGHVRLNPTGNSSSDQNRYRLTVSDPAGDYALNHGVYSNSALSVLDYEVTIPMRGGATITLIADAVDGVQLRNLTNVMVPDDDPNYPIVANQPYQGQFMQLDGSIDT